MKRRPISEPVAMGVLVVLVVVIIASVLVAWIGGDPGEAQKTLRDIALVLGGALGGGAGMAVAMSYRPPPLPPEPPHEEGEG